MVGLAARRRISRRPKFKSNLSLNFSNLLIQAAIDGLGIAMGNVINAGDDLRHGRLIKPIDFTVKTDTGYLDRLCQGRAEAARRSRRSATG